MHPKRKVVIEAVGSAMKFKGLRGWFRVQFCSCEDCSQRAMLYDADLKVYIFAVSNMGRVTIIEGAIENDGFLWPPSKEVILQEDLDFLVTKDPSTPWNNLRTRTNGMKIDVFFGWKRVLAYLISLWPFLKGSREIVRGF